MARSNDHLLLFDPVIDTFESLHQRSTFCFTVILSIASQAQADCVASGQLCEEANKLVAASLFQNPTQIEAFKPWLCWQRTQKQLGGPLVTRTRWPWSWV
ncbi:hypothetical protein ABVK25_011788 [Lepraria finkii]|uniref:Uncharacterized protein n=1 Tax=Lepraria finkii TaxID=1340010 RepID=A0ABR4AL61_9LECA